MNKLQQKIESLLFYKNEPVSFSWLAKQLSISPKELSVELYEMQNYYENRGIKLLISEDKASIVTAEISNEIIAKIARHDEKKELSKQALETISIILYSGKISKLDLDYIRGVNSVYILRNLLIRGLIEKIINPDDKRSPLYAATHETMSFLGITKIDDLPKFKYYKNKLTESVEEIKTEDAGEIKPN